MRAAFLANFADDGINFSPGPGNTKDRFRARPEAIEPFVLDWHPAIAAVSHAGDLGFTTGPYTIAGRGGSQRAPAYGTFFSVWRRDEAGPWRVIVDGGVSTREPAPDSAFGDDPQVSHQLPSSGASAKEMLGALETQTTFDGSAQAGYARLLADDARLIVEPGPPRLGREAILAALAARRLGFRWETLAAGVARSGDLAWSYGRLHLLTPVEAEGHYVHVWTRDPGGRWRIAAEVLLLPES